MPRYSPAVLEALPLAAARIRLRQQAVSAHPGWSPLPHQRPPEDDDWLYWLLWGGRGSGKTAGAAHYVDAYMGAGEPKRLGIIAPKLGTARAVCVEGETGLLSINRSLAFNRSWGELRWPNGSFAQIFGAYTPEDVEALRGPQFHLVWAEELAAWRQLDGCWDMMRLGLRLGSRPHAVISTTPKPRKLLQRLLAEPSARVSRATTHENPHLDAAVRAELERQYGGTRLGRQELGGELLEDIEGALWQASWIDANRVAEHPPLTRIVVAIDPSATSEATSDYTGLCAAGLGEDGDYYVLRSAGVRLSPSGWASRAIDWYDEYQADRVVAEINNGGEMVGSTLHSLRRDLPVKVIHASRGKTVRAEPIATLDEQGCIHHVGHFATLEDQMFSFPVANEHDDEVDARVYALTELLEGVKKIARFY